MIQFFKFIKYMFSYTLTLFVALTGALLVSECADISLDSAIILSILCVCINLYLRDNR